MSYDINQIFAEMELELIESYKRSVAKGTGKGYDSWQKRKLEDIKLYQTEARKIVDKHTRRAKFQATNGIASNYGRGVKQAELMGMRSPIDDMFHKMNRRKMDALIDAVNNDFNKAGMSALRMTEDKYREVMFKSQMFLSSGTMTLNQAIDKAAGDFLHKGINSIQYANGRKVNIATYAEMSLRTANKRAYLTGEGARMAEQGEYLVQVTSYGGCSDTCLPWQGKVYFDDVYAGGKPNKDNKYPLLSVAMENGLYHPNCRHTHDPFIEGISDYKEPPFDNDKIRQVYAAEQRQRAIERKIREWKRVEAGSVDKDNRDFAAGKVKAWQKSMRDHIQKHPFLTRKYPREKIRMVDSMTEAPDLAQRIASVRGMSSGVAHEQSAKEVGREVLKDLKAARKDKYDKMNTIRQKMKESGYLDDYNRVKEIQKQMSRSAWKNLGYESAEAMEKDYKERVMRIAKQSELKREFDRAAMDYAGNPYDNAAELKATLSQVREMGYDMDEIGEDMLAHLGYSDEAMDVMDAYSYLPRDWVEASLDHGKLDVVRVDRGYYNHGWGEIGISGDLAEQRLNCALHELGHRMERVVDGAKLERQFYKRRTAGESLEWLGPPYDKSETTRKDKFINPYMGKDYGGSAYEIISLGIEWAYLEPVRLWRDPDLAEFIYGLLASL